MRHAYEPDPTSLEGDCAFCGLPHPDNGLQDEPRFDYDVPDEIPACPRCRHFQHSKGECRVVLDRWAGSVCGCKARAAA